MSINDLSWLDLTGGTLPNVDWATGFTPDWGDLQWGPVQESLGAPAEGYEWVWEPYDLTDYGQDTGGGAGSAYDPSTDLTGGAIPQGNLPDASAAPPASQPSTLAWWLKTLGLGGLGALSVGALAQYFFAGDPETKQEVQRIMGTRSPEEQQAFQQAVTGLQGGNTMLFGDPTGGGGLIPAAGPLAAQGQLGLQALLPMLTSELARVSGQTGPAADALYQAIAGRIGQQGQISDPLATTAAGLARGMLPITPELQETVNQAFEPSVFNLLQQAREKSRQMGWYDDVLNAPPAAALLGPALAQLQGQKAAATLDLATGLPRLAGDLMRGYDPQVVSLGSYLSSLENLRRLSLGDVGQTSERLGFGLPISLLNAITGLTTAGTGAAGQRPELGQTTTATTPRSILDLLPGLGSLAGGAGGLLYGIGTLSGVR